MTAGQPQFDSTQGEWPHADLERVRLCPVCGSKEREVLHDGLRDHVFYCAPGAWTLKRCLACRAAYLDPRPTPESIGQAYMTYYTHDGSWRLEPEQLSTPRRFFRSLTNGYLNARFGTRFRPASALGRVLAYLFPWKRMALNGLGRHLPRNAEGRSLLDVGCGSGNFIEFAQNAGWRASGVDPDPNAVAFCRGKGLSVEEGGIERFAKKRELFDRITLNHIIEHVHEPSVVLAACHRLLKRDGSLWISTPNKATRRSGEIGEGSNRRVI